MRELMIVVNKVLVEKVEISNAKEAMIEARKKTAKTAPCSAQFGPCSAVSARNDSIASCGQPCDCAMAICCVRIIDERICNTTVISTSIIANETKTKINTPSSFPPS